MSSVVFFVSGLASKFSHPIMISECLCHSVQNPANGFDVVRHVLGDVNLENVSVITLFRKLCFNIIERESSERSRQGKYKEWFPFYETEYT